MWISIDVIYFELGLSLIGLILYLDTYYLSTYYSEIKKIGSKSRAKSNKSVSDLSQSVRLFGPLNCCVSVREFLNACCLLFAL